MKPFSVKPLIFVLLAMVLNFTGCAVTSSGNMVGEAASLRYSTAEKTFRFMEVGTTFAGTDHTIEAPHGDMHGTVKPTSRVPCSAACSGFIPASR